MASIDYNALRAQTLGSGNDEEAVTVNTRALIDKVLARYSGEWTVLRELLQNAADASATKVTVKFETSPSATVPVPASSDPTTLLKHVVKNHTLSRLVVTNNGHPFEASDWARLKRIAEGNPDETKIGAFGVGFYSVFADCEEPFVSSGKEAMAFYWKGNSLFTRRSQISSAQANSDTSFVLDYRAKTHSVPGIMGLCQFLATSLTFVGLETIELHLDEWKLLSLVKKRAPSQDVALPRTIETKTNEGTFQIQKVEKQSVQIDAHYMKIICWKPSQGLSISSFTSVFSGNERSRDPSNSGAIRNWFSRLTAPPPVETQTQQAREGSNTAAHKTPVEDLTARETSTIFLRISTALLKTSVSQTFARELERATKKPPPKSTTLALLTSSYDEAEASKSSNSDGDDIFVNVLPSKSGRVFIGFPTHQTTGALAHVAAHSIIPTVERESIDLNARWVRTWNVELLRAAGIVGRISWSSEMGDIQEKIHAMLKRSGKTKITASLVEEFLPHAVHVFRQYTFKESTPLTEVSSIIEEAFWTSSRTASIEVFSTRGVLPSGQVRLSTENLSFVDGIPFLQDDLCKKAEAFVYKLRDFSLVTPVTIADVQTSLSINALDEKQLEDFLKWASGKAIAGELDPRTTQTLLDTAIVAVPSKTDSQQTSILALASIKSFVVPTRVPAELPIPPYTIAFQYTKGISFDNLRALGWTDLQIAPWLRFLLGTDGPNGLSKDQQLTVSPAFAAKVLPILSKQWDNSLSSSAKATIVSLVSDKTIIPTKNGMKVPRETYFPSVKLFLDLSIVHGLNNVKEKILIDFGVRKTVELGLIFERLLSSQTGVKSQDKDVVKWSHVDLIKYLSSVQADIPKDDIRRLKDTPICPKKVEDGPSNELFKVSALFDPKTTHMALRLPVLFWPSPFKFQSSEGRFLRLLGLRDKPSAAEIVSILASSFRLRDFTLRENALGYFLANYEINGYASFNIAEEPQSFLPLSDDPEGVASPSNCFTTERATALGFHILRRDLCPHALKLGVQADPPMRLCLERLLAKPPQNRKEAQEKFGYLAQRLASIDDSTALKFGQAKIVPVPPRQGRIQTQSKEALQSIRFISPRSCYLGTGDIWSAMFDFVDFGQEANRFLLTVGAKHEPNRTEMARLMASEPQRILDEFNSVEKYLDVLRSLAEYSPTLKKDRKLWKEMQRSKFLLGYKELKAESNHSSKKSKLPEDSFAGFEDEYAERVKEFTLASPDQITLVNDVVSYNAFSDHLLVCPQEEILEDFYAALGASHLSDLVQEETRIGMPADDQKPADSLRALILERLPLLLHDYKPSAIRHDMRWFEKNLSVKNVRAIKLRRTLKGKSLSFIETRTAAMNQNSDGWVLYIVFPELEMFHVSQALVNLIMVKPQSFSPVLFEKLLETDLLRLRKQGYNVERILRKKHAEARLAEQNRRREAQEAEQRELEARQKQMALAPSSLEKELPSTPPSSANKDIKMPGAFGTPEESPPPYDQSNHEGLVSPSVQGTRSPKQKSLFSSIAKRFGRDDSRSIAGPSSSSSTTIMEPELHDQPQTQATPPAELRQTLNRAIKASRPHDSDSIFSRPTTNAIHEQSSYCDSTTGQNISLVGLTPASRRKVFASLGLQDRDAFVSNNSVLLERFSSLLTYAASVYGVRPDTLHIFVDEAGSTIAFNRSGSLFANFRYFLQLHAQAKGHKELQEAFVYWWVVLAHELAHNLVEDHSARHSYYTENMVAEFFAEAAIVGARWAEQISE